MSWLDRLVPFLVGHRTQIIGIGVALLQILSDAGVVSPHLVQSVTMVAAPLAVATFAAKVERIAAKP